MDKEEAKKAMTSSIFRYISQQAVLEILASQDAVNMLRLKDLCVRIKVVNDNMKTNVDRATPEELENIINTFTYPDESL